MSAFVCWEGIPQIDTKHLWPSLRAWSPGLLFSWIVDVHVRRVVVFFSKEGVNRLWILVCQLPGLYTFYLKSEPSVLGVSLPSPMAYCTQRLSVLWFALPHHMTSLKVPPPFSLFISSKLFEMRGVSQSQTSFPSTTACLRICQRGLRRAFFFLCACVCAQKIPEKI